jgi:uncharacterized protein (TIGR03083 family)
VIRDPRLWISALRISQDRLRGLVAPLVPEGVDTPSMASGWSIAQVLSHLGSQAEIFGGILDDAVAHRPLPGPETFPPVWDEWNAKSGVDQVTDSVAANEAFVRRVEELPDAQLEALQFLMFGMEFDMVGFLRMRLSELAVHTWDVAAALDPEATVSAHAVDLLVDTLPELARRVGKGQASATSVRVITSGPARDLVLGVDDAVSIEPWEGGPADATLRLPAEAWVRLVYGRLDDEHSPPIEIDGDREILATLRLVFPGV